MRVLVVFLFAALMTSAHSEGTPFANSSSLQAELRESIEPEAQTFIPFWKKKKKKKLKASNRMKKSNKRMGKGFKRKNDDSLRRD